MKRRAILQSLLAVPAAVAVPVPAPAQQSPSGSAGNRETPPTPATTIPDATAEGMVKTFTPAQFSALRHLGEILVPKSKDLPGAAEAGAAEFLDFLIGVSPLDVVKLYRDGLDRLNAEAQRRYQKPFSEITPAEADPILGPLKEAWSYRGPSDPFARFLQDAKRDLRTATVNSRDYIAVAAERRRGAGGMGQYWYPAE